MHGNRDAVVKESADLIYNLVVLWVASGVQPKEVWKEMERRERLFGIAEKLPKDARRGQDRAPQGRRARKPRACASGAEQVRIHLAATLSRCDGHSRDLAPLSSRAMLRRLYDWCFRRRRTSRMRWLLVSSRSSKARSFRSRPTSC